MSLVSRYLDPALLERLSALALSARRVVEGMTPGRHRSPVRGASVEFRQHRLYAAGDEIRRLDWRVLARTDRPYVREYEEETNLRCMFLLDASGSMGYAGVRSARREKGGVRQSKLDYARRIVATLAHLMLSQTESVGLATFCAGRLDDSLAPRAHPEQLARIIHRIERTSAAGRSEVAPAMMELANRLHRRSLVIIVSDLLSPAPALRAALSRLCHGHHEIVTLRVLDADEVDFPFSAPLRLRGMEGESARLCDPALARRRYLDQFHSHERQLHEAHRALGAEFRTLRTDRDLGDALIDFLRHRG